MIKKLPIVLSNSNTLIFDYFMIKKEHNKIIINYHNSEKVKIPCVNNYNCIYYLEVEFPLIFHLINGNYINNNFFILYLQAQNQNKLNFFNELDIKLPDIKFINKNINNIISLLLNNIKTDQDKIDLYYNISLYINYEYPNFTIKSLKQYEINDVLNKKIVQIGVLMREIKFSYKESHCFSLNEHINNINSEIKPFDGLECFYKNDKKQFKVEILKKENKLYVGENEVKIENLRYYPMDINKTGIFNYFCLLNKDYVYEKLLDEIKLKKKSVLDINNLEEIEELMKNDFMYNFKLLCENYNFPINYNRKDLDSIFDKLVIACIVNKDKIIDKIEDKVYFKNEFLELIPMKLRTLLFNLVKIYYMVYERNDFNIIVFNYKLFHDFIHYEVFKIILQTDNLISKLLLKDINKFNKIKKIFTTVIYLEQISKKIKWKNISKRLEYLSELYNFKEYIFFNERLNKTIIPENMDSRIKKLLHNPFEMFKYLKKEKDFIKWIVFISNQCNMLFNNSINLLEDDLEDLGKIIYLLVNIEKQDVKDKSYRRFLKFCRNNEKLILYDSRINLKIKDYFKFLKININLGFLAKHLTWNDSTIISLDDDTETKSLKKELEETKLKYQKYKTKYVRLKEIASSEMISLSKSNFIDI